MFIQDIEAEYGSSVLGKSKTDELHLVIRSKEEDRWYLIPLTPQGRERREWCSGAKYLEVNGSALWVAVFHGWNSGVGHMLYEVPENTTSGQQVITMDLKGAETTLVLRWKVSQDKSDCDIASFPALQFSHLDAYAHYFYREFRLTMELPFVSNAIDAWTKAMKTATTTAEKASASRLLASAVYSEFNLTGDTTTIANAIAPVKAVIALMSAEDSQMAPLLMDLGAYQTANVRHGLPFHLPDIEESISNLRSASVLLESADSALLAECLGSLSASLETAYQFTNRVAYLDEAVDAGRKGVGLTVEGDDLLPKRLADLGSVFSLRFQHGQVLDDAEQATSLIQQAIALAEQRDDAPTQTMMLNKLGKVFIDIFRRTDDISHIQLSIQTYQRAASLASESELAGVLSPLGIALDSAFYRTGNRLQLEEAISVSRRSIALTPKGDPALPERLRNLGVVLARTFEQSDNLKTMQEAISCFRRAVDMTPRTDETFQPCLVSLSDALATRARFTGGTKDLDEAIRIQRDYVQEQDASSPRLPEALRYLGYLWIRSVTLGGDVENIREAIAAFQKAISLREPGHHDIPLLYNSIGNAWHRAFSKLRQMEDIDAAIDAKRKAVALLPEWHAMLPIFLQNLGRSLKLKFGQDQRMDTIQEAIECQQRCIDVAAEGHEGLQVWYGELALSFDVKFKKTGELCDIDGAIEMLERILRIVPAGHIDIPHWEDRLGDSFIKRSKVTSMQEDIEKAINHYRTSALCSRGYTSQRVKAAEKWAEHSRPIDIESSIDGYERAIDLISVFVGLEQTQNRRHENIAQISGLSRAAAATALEAGELMKAVDWLERGRCLVWSQLESLRTPVDDLRLVDEPLAERLLAVSKGIEESSGPVKGESASLDLAVEWRNLIAKIREMEGFEDFLRTRSFTMNGLPPHGTVVVINVHSSRCDALALRLGWCKPLHIPLQDLSLSKTQKMAERLKGYLGQGGVRTRDYDLGEEQDDERAIRKMRRGATEVTLKEILRELWRCVVGPILDAIRQPGTDTPQRIWWCPTGPLSFLPLHAAGAFDGIRNTALDIAISSYTPSISILVNQMKIGITSRDNSGGLLIISQPNTPGHTPLPGTIQEVKALQSAIRLSTVDSKHLEGELATQDSCIGALGNYDSVHLAYHAFQHAKEPLSSGFILHDGQLKLEKIMEKNFKSAELAFLSACQTSTGDEKLSEEAVHLAAGMVAAGYRSVVATMWSIKDKYAPEVATAFYTELLRLNLLSGGVGIDGSHAAEALHYAVSQLREKLGDDEDALLTWVPYVHLGA